MSALVAPSLLFDDLIPSETDQHTQASQVSNFTLHHTFLNVQEVKMPYTVFQPLYIYGPHTAKDCEQWFMDRVAR
jgi:hypothetical protein